MINFPDDWMGPQFRLPQADKEVRLLAELNALMMHHRLGCPGYGRFLDGMGWSADRTATRLADLPPLPVGLFKSHELRSVPETEIFRVLSSSGTTGSRTSRVYIDRAAAALQVRALSAVMTSLLGPARLPMLIIDAKATVSRRDQVNARTAGVLGMMTFGRDHLFALRDSDMSPDWAAVAAFLDRHAGKPLFVFGFTFMVWASFVFAAGGAGLDLSAATLVHGGGWKKLQEEAVDNAAFRAALKARFGLQRVHNYYGMIEQLGSVFPEDDDGWLHPPDFADFIVRNPQTWEEARPGEPGIIEVISILPRSYPGHLVLTEDMGIWQPEDSRPGRWCGKRLQVTGRVPKTELRGCSDVHAYGTRS